MSVPAEQPQTDQRQTDLREADQRSADQRSAGPGAVGAADREDDAPGPPSSRSRLGTLAVLVVIGVELALLGGFLTLSEPHLLGLPLPIGPAVGLLANGAFGLWTVRRVGRTAVAAPAFGWIVTVLFLSSTRPEGDLIITNDVKGLAFLLLGSLAWAGAAIAGRTDVPLNPIDQAAVRRA